MMTRTETRLDYVRRRLGELGVPAAHIGWSPSRAGELQVLVGQEFRTMRVGPMATQKAIDEQVAKIEAAIRRARA
jgi:hypothetical protein